MQKWKQKKTRKPLIIRGARQVEKTWMMKELGKTEYENFAYINFEDNQQLKTVFVSHTFSLSGIRVGYASFSGRNLEKGIRILSKYL